jgi:hypothetical protein
MTNTPLMASGDSTVQSSNDTTTPVSPGSTKQEKPGYIGGSLHKIAAPSESPTAKKIDKIPKKKNLTTESQATNIQHADEKLKTAKNKTTNPFKKITQLFGKITHGNTTVKSENKVLNTEESKASKVLSPEAQVSKLKASVVNDIKSLEKAVVDLGELGLGLSTVAKDKKGQDPIIKQLIQKKTELNSISTDSKGLKKRIDDITTDINYNILKEGGMEGMERNEGTLNIKELVDLKVLIQKKTQSTKLLDLLKDINNEADVKGILRGKEKKLGSMIATDSSGIVSYERKKLDELFEQNKLLLKAKDQTKLPSVKIEVQEAINEISTALEDLESKLPGDLKSLENEVKDLKKKKGETPEAKKIIDEQIKSNNLKIKDISAEIGLENNIKKANSLKNQDPLDIETLGIIRTKIRSVEHNSKRLKEKIDNAIKEINELLEVDTNKELNEINNKFVHLKNKDIRENINGLLNHKDRLLLQKARSTPQMEAKVDAAIEKINSTSLPIISADARTKLDNYQIGSEGHLDGLLDSLYSLNRIKSQSSESASKKINDLVTEINTKINTEINNLIKEQEELIKSDNSSQKMRNNDAKLLKFVTSNVDLVADPIKGREIFIKQFTQPTIFNAIIQLSIARQNSLQLSENFRFLGFGEQMKKEIESNQYKTDIEAFKKNINDLMSYIELLINPTNKGQDYESQPYAVTEYVIQPINLPTHSGPDENRIPNEGTINAKNAIVEAYTILNGKEAENLSQEQLKKLQEHLTHLQDVLAATTDTDQILIQFFKSAKNLT